MTIDELAQTIQTRIDALHGEIAVLEAARTELRTNASASDRPTANGSAPERAAANGSGSSRPGRNGSKTVARSRRGKPKAKAGTEVVRAGKLEVMLARHDGITTTALAELVNGEREQVLTLLREMETAGRARRSGERRGTRWHAITDEDRINARAAELEKQSRQARTQSENAD